MDNNYYIIIIIAITTLIDDRSIINWLQRLVKPTDNFKNRIFFPIEIIIILIIYQNIFPF